MSVPLYVTCVKDDDYASKRHRFLASVVKSTGGFFAILHRVNFESSEIAPHV